MLALAFLMAGTLIARDDEDQMLREEVEGAMLHRARVDPNGSILGNGKLTGQDGDIVRLEIAKDELARALDPAMAAEFARIFKALGFKFVTLDLEGFRSGSMNALLPPEDLMRAV
jgi:uncharacterized protein